MTTLQFQNTVLDEVCPAGEAWMCEVKKGQLFRIVDLEGNQAVDTLFISAENPDERYSATDTLTQNQQIYLEQGTTLYSNFARPIATIVEDNCGRHDTLGGACSSQSNTVRYAREKRYMHNCRDSFMLQLADTTADIKKRDLAPNINFFMNVPITKEGGYKFDDGVSAPGKYVEMKALADVMILISNCPQLNNPCNAYNPTPVRLLIWD